MESNENEVQSELVKCIKHYDDARDLHEALLNLPLPEDEVVRQSQWFQAKMTLFCDFIKKVKEWRTDAGQPYIEPQDSKTLDDQIVADVDEIRPEDSVSNVSCPKLNFSKAPSQLSRFSYTSSARIKVEAEKAALSSITAWL